MSTDRVWKGVGGSMGLVLALILPVAASGQGFGIYEQGSCVMGRAGAAVAHPCGDASSIFFNPAALAGVDSPVLSAGVTGIVTTGEFAPDGTRQPTDLDTRTVPVPHVFFGYSPAPDWGLGVGLYAPYGLETTWPVDDFEGRFIGYDNALRTVYLQPTAAWSPSPGVSFGAGLTLVWSEVEVNRRIDLAETPLPPTPGVPPGTTFGDIGIPDGTDFADSSLEGDNLDGLGVGGHLAALFDLSEAFRVGARYLFQVEADYEGDATFEQVPTGITLGSDNPFGFPAGTPLDNVLQGLFSASGPLTDQDVRTSITMPDQVVVGFAWDATERVTVAADYQWTDWTDFDVVVLDFEEEATPDEELEQNFESTSGIRLGVDVALTPEWTARGGYVYNEAAAPDAVVTPLLPEAERNSVTAGLGWASDSFRIDGAYMFIGQADRRGRVESPPPGQAPSTALNTGTFSFDGHLFGLSLAVIF